MKLHSNDDKTKRATSYFQCACGLWESLDLTNGPVGFEIECPEPECRRMYEIKYVGRRREFAETQPPVLRLVATGETGV